MAVEGQSRQVGPAWGADTPPEHDVNPKKKNKAALFIKKNMPFFGSSATPFDQDVERATNEKNTGEDWGLIMDLCDRVLGIRDGPRDCLKSILKRLNHNDPHVVLKAVTLLDACVNNCGKPFRLEVASREFEQEFVKILRKSHPKVQEKLKSVLKKWAENEFKGDPQLALIPSLYGSLKREFDFHGSSEPQPRSLPKDPNVVANQQEEDDIAKAIQLSLQDAPKQAAATSLYPSVQGAAAAAKTASQPQASASTNGAGTKEPKKARALYDFEAAEDNELTFKTGEIVIIIDDSDQNWWKGSNHRGEGLFPANFVSTDLKAESEQAKEEKQGRRRSVQFNDEVEVKTVAREDDAAAAGPVRIEEAQIDRVLAMLHDADPTTDENDPNEMPALETRANSMGPMIDTELETVDRRLAQLTRLSTELVDALNLYHQLMREAPPQPMTSSPMQQPYYSMPPMSMPPAHSMGPGMTQVPQFQPPPQFAPVCSSPSPMGPAGGMTSLPPVGYPGAPQDPYASGMWAAPQVSMAQNGYGYASAGAGIDQQPRSSIASTAPIYNE